jgi:plastocyanin
MPTRTGHLMATGLAVIALAFAGCGDDDSGGSNGSSGGGDPGGYGGGAYGSGDTGKEDETQGGGGGGTTLKLSADPGGALKFDRSSLTAKAGDVTIDLTNPSGATAPHAVEIEGQGVEEESDTIEPGNSASVTAKLEPGEYEFYCPVGNQQDAGMEGTLTVH